MEVVSSEHTLPALLLLLLRRHDIVYGYGVLELDEMFGKGLAGLWGKSW
jgi:hypothetical protein